jgi:MFS family permease
MNLDVPARSFVIRPRATEYRNHIGLAVILAGIFVTVMDGAIVNVAIPSIRITLGASFAEAELVVVVVGYIFIFAIGMITGGRLGDIFGQRRIFLAGFAAFTLTSALCGLAPGPLMLIMARLLQGASASLLSPQVLSLVRLSCPRIHMAVSGGIVVMIPGRHHLSFSPPACPTSHAGHGTIERCPDGP